MTPHPGVRPENQRLLAVLDEILSRPDDLGEAWWCEFEAMVRHSGFGGEQ